MEEGCGWGSRWSNGEVRWWTWTGTGYMAWIWKGGNAGVWWCRVHEGGLGVAPWMKMRSVFGTCMVSGIRRREKVRE